MTKHAATFAPIASAELTPSGGNLFSVKCCFEGQTGDIFQSGTFTCLIRAASGDAAVLGARAAVEALPSEDLRRFPEDCQVWVEYVVEVLEGLDKGIICQFDCDADDLEHSFLEPAFGYTETNRLEIPAEADYTVPPLISWGRKATAVPNPRPLVEFGLVDEK